MSFEDETKHVGAGALWGLSDHAVVIALAALSTGIVVGLMAVLLI